MATVPAPPPVHPLSSSSLSHHFQDKPTPSLSLPPNPDPQPKNPSSPPNRPSSPSPNSDHPPPTPPHPFPVAPLASFAEFPPLPPPPPAAIPSPLPPDLSAIPSASPSHRSPPPPPPPQHPSSAPPPLFARRPSSGYGKSFAQVTGGSRGPGFVRAHASDVESFARLPRTGVKIICGSREGIPSFSFVPADLPKVEEIYSKALVMKFHGGRPSLESSHREIRSWGIEHPFSIGPLSSRAFLLRFQDDRDLIRVLSRPSNILISFPYKIFRWHNQCHMKEDSCFAPIWISLPKLPLQCFIPEFLESVANKIGRFLCFDKATATLARPSAARLCVELDLRKPPPQSIWIGLFEGQRQPIIYERVPKFCVSCLVQGHMAADCPRGHRETRPQQPDPRELMVRGRTPAARRNATPSPASSLQQQTIPIAPPPAIPTPTSSSYNPNPPPPPHPPHPLEAHQQSPLTENNMDASSSQISASFPPPPTPTPPPPPPPPPNPDPPKYCNECLAQGHIAAECPKGQRETHPPQANSYSKPDQVCTHHVRENASATASHQLPLTRQTAAASSAGSVPCVQVQPSIILSTLAQCSAQGHMDVEYPTGQREATSKQADLHSTSFHGCTPPDRQNAQRDSSTTSALQNASAPQNQTSSNPPSLYAEPNHPPPKELCEAPVISIPSDNGNQNPKGAAATSFQEPQRQSFSKHQTNPADPHPKQSARKQSKAQKHKSVTIAPQQSNVEANKAHWEAVNRQVSILEQARLSAPAEGTPCVCQNAELPTSANNVDLATDQQIEHPYSAAKSIILNQADQNPLLQQQQEALERFKQKVRAQTQSLGQQLIGSNSANPFEPLMEDQSDDEDDDYISASFNSDTDDGSVEPIDMGYQSADGRSSHNHTKSSASVMKTNKRHPNIPLNVKLRTRKNSYSSSHKYLCM